MSAKPDLLLFLRLQMALKEIPSDWIAEDGVSMTAKFIKYCQPLIQGEVEVPYENGLPAYVRLSKRRFVRFWIHILSNKVDLVNFFTQFP